MVQEIPRRRYLESIGALSVATALAGCGGDPDWCERHRQDFEYDMRVHQWIDESETIGVRWGDEQWKFEIDQYNDSDLIDVRAKKILLDNSGNVQEWPDAAIEYTRTKIEPGEIIRFESNARMWYVEAGGSEVYLAFGKYLDDEFKENKRKCEEKRGGSE